ncbi:MAG: hypothetical protein AAF527_01205, partial [Pseudomonadota bacterium]
PLLHRIAIAAPIKRRGAEVKLTLAAPGNRGRRQANADAPTPIVQAIANAHVWMRRLIQEPRLTQRALAAELGVAPARIAKTLPLAFLAPSIVEDALAGRLPPEIEIDDLAPIDPDWRAQRWRIDQRRSSTL